MPKPPNERDLFIWDVDESISLQGTFWFSERDPAASHVTWFSFTYTETVDDGTGQQQHNDHTFIVHALHSEMFEAYWILPEDGSQVWPQGVVFKPGVMMAGTNSMGAPFFRMVCVPWETTREWKDYDLFDTVQDACCELVSAWFEAQIDAHAPNI